MTKQKIIPKYNIINNMSDLKERDLIYNSNYVIIIIKE